MVYTRRTIPYTYGDSIRLVLLADPHIGCPGFARRHFRAFLKEELAPPNSYLLLMGDIFDAIVPADSKRFQPSIIDQKHLAEGPDMALTLALRDCIEELEPYKSQILGIMMGNHEWQFMRRYSINLTDILCNRLEAENLGISCLMRLVFREEEGRGRSIVIYAHHGFGGASRTEGGSLTKYERNIKSYKADIYLYGHDHETWDKDICCLGIDQNGNMQHRDILMACCGSFKKTISDGPMPTWEEVRGFSPKRIGGMVIALSPERNHRVTKKRIL